MPPARRASSARRAAGRRRRCRTARLGPASDAASANTSPRRNSQRSATPFSRAGLGRQGQRRLGAVDAEHRFGAAMRRHHGRTRRHSNTGRAPARRAASPAIKRGCRAGRKTSRSSGRPTHRPETARRFPSSDTGPLDRAERDPRLQRQPFQRARRAVVAQHDRVGGQQPAQRLDDQRQQPVHAGGVGLHDQHAAEPVNDQPRQAVRLGMHQPVIGRVVQPLAQPQRAFEAARKEPRC